jgi:hypothetical protein
MAKKIAVSINKVNGFDLFQYLETFFENDFAYKTLYDMKNIIITDKKPVRYCNAYTVQTENTIRTLKPDILKSLKL